jgi:hypothetical protein
VRRRVVVERAERQLGGVARHAPANATALLSLDLGESSTHLVEGRRRLVA